MLMKHNGNVSACAREAGLDRSNFIRLCRSIHIVPGVFRGYTSLDEEITEAKRPCTESEE